MGGETGRSGPGPEHHRTKDSGERDPGEQAKLHFIEALAASANGLSPVIDAAIDDLLRIESSYWGEAGDRLQRKLEGLREGSQEVTALRLYELAKRCAGKDYELDERISFLAPEVKSGNVWETFTGFAKAWDKKGTEELAEEELPSSQWLDLAAIDKNIRISVPKDPQIEPATLLARIEKVSTSVREVRNLIWLLIGFAIAFAIFR